VLPLQEEATGRLGLIASAVAAGLAAQTVQVVCLREILQTARGGEVVLGLALASWLVGTSLGAVTWRGRPLTAALLVVIAPALLLPGLRLMPPSPGGWAPAAALLAAAGAYAPGAFFATVLRRLEARGALAAEAIGACAAGALLTFLLLWALPAWTLVVLAGLLCCAAAGARRWWIALLLLAAFPVGWGMDRATLPPPRLWRGSELVRTTESPYGRLLWLRRGEQRSLFVNGQLALTVPDEVGAEAFANLVLAAHPQPKSVLVIGLGGVGGILRECRRHPSVDELEVAIQDRQALALVRAELPDRDVLAGARVRFGDPRRIAAAVPRDVVLVLAPEPSTLAANRYYTREFFAAVRLRPGGVLALQLPAAPNVREGEILARNVSVYRALAPMKVRVLPGAHDLLLASEGAAPEVTPEALLARLRERAITLRHHAQDFFAEPFRAGELERVNRTYAEYPERPPPAVPFAVAETPSAAPAPEALPNRDLHPGAVLHSAGALAREEQVDWLRTAARFSFLAPAVLLPLAALGALLAWWRGRRAAASLAAATAGATSMGLWIVILMAYQARVGALYGDFALLAAAFMAGFALGARVRAGAARLDLVFVLVSFLVWVTLPFGGRLLFVVLAALVGAAGGATVATAAATFRSAAPRLYAWDVTGAALAALLFGTFLVPALGATAACAVAGGLKLFSLLGNLLARRGVRTVE
jgi:spermidine synthase